MAEGSDLEKSEAPTPKRLSEARAESVRQALVAKGIDGARIEVAGYGEHDKAVETEGAVEANRRVAIRVSAR